MEKEKYRIDRAYEKVYEYNEEDNAYWYLTNFLSIDAIYTNRDSTIIKKIEKWKNDNLYS